jgi:hypothetical protein
MRLFRLVVVVVGHGSRLASVHGRRRDVFLATALLVEAGQRATRGRPLDVFLFLGGRLDLVLWFLSLVHRITSHAYT